MKKSLIVLAVLAILASGARAQDADATSRERNRVLIDTNATTTVTAYTASAINVELIGAVGGSNAVWKALRATATNWVKVAQDTSAR